MIPSGFVADLENALRAGFTLVSVITGEESRARRLVEATSEALGLRVATWTPTAGVSLRATLEQVGANDGDPIREAHLLVDPGAEIDAHVTRLLREVGLGQRRAIVVLLASGLDLSPDLDREMALVERVYIAQALARTEQNRSRAADLLGVKRTTLVEKIKRLERMGLME